MTCLKGSPRALANLMAPDIMTAFAVARVAANAMAAGSPARVCGIDDDGGDGESRKRSRDPRYGRLPAQGRPLRAIVPAVKLTVAYKGGEQTIVVDPKGADRHLREGRPRRPQARGGDHRPRGPGGRRVDRRPAHSHPALRATFSREREKVNPSLAPHRGRALRPPRPAPVRDGRGGADRHGRAGAVGGGRGFRRLDPHFEQGDRA